MPTEITDNNGFENATGWLGYDAECPWCARGARVFGPLLATRGVRLVPLQAPWLRARLGLVPGTRPDEMVLLEPDGGALGGADAIVALAGRFWWAWPVSVAARVPAIRGWLGDGYRWIAERRPCLHDTCRVTPRPIRRAAANPTVDWLPLIVLLVLAWLGRNRVPAWVYMWWLAGGMFAGCKWATARQLARHERLPPRRLARAYLAGWVGMNAREFTLTPPPTRPPLREWLLAGLKITLGLWLLCGLTPAWRGDQELLAAWSGMIGFVFLLHFGAFHLLAIAWQRAGVNARPIMRAPLRATGLAEFWGRRWNTAFHELVHGLVFHPVGRRFGAVFGMFAAFLASGLVHDLVISLPARGGYGWPTAYFLVQGVAVLFERGPWGRRLGLGRGVRGWCFTMLCVGAPIGWLFHPAFMHHVILPMLTAIGIR